MGIFKNIINKMQTRFQAPLERAVSDSCREHIDSQRGVGGKWKKRVLLYSIEKRKGVTFKVPSPFNNLPLLKRTKSLYNSIRTRLVRSGQSMSIVISGEHYGIYQDKGFTTKGPNFIPLTTRKFGKKSGRDFFIARNGVTVPSRTFLDPLMKDINDFSKIVARSAADSAAREAVENLKSKGKVKWHRTYS